MLNFWFSTFLLPKGCVKKLDALCSRFLWSGNIETKKGIKVAWLEVCRPKKEGGLGIRKLTEWNKTLCLKLFWLLFVDTESLWSRWNKIHYLRGKSIWEIDSLPRQTWTWRTLLHLRQIAEGFLMSQVGNGRDTSFWYDAWTPFGPLIKYLGEQGPSQLRIPWEAKVADATDDTGWIVHPARSRVTRHFLTHLATIITPTSERHKDYFTWKNGETHSTKFSAIHTWNAIRQRGEEISWSKLIWFKGGVPRFAFNMWVAQLNRLPTKQRLSQWDPNISSACDLCLTNAETREHLFLHCSYTAQLWYRIFGRISPAKTLFGSWIELLDWMRSYSTTAPSLLRKLLAQTLAYHVWKQRNNRAHNNQVLDVDTTFKWIDRDVRNTISARRHR